MRSFDSIEVSGCDAGLHEGIAVRTNTCVGGSIAMDEWVGANATVGCSSSGTALGRALGVTGNTSVGGSRPRTIGDTADRSTDATPSAAPDTISVGGSPLRGSAAPCVNSDSALVSGITRDNTSVGGLETGPALAAGFIAGNTSVCGSRLRGREDPSPGPAIATGFIVGSTSVGGSRLRGSTARGVIDAPEELRVGSNGDAGGLVCADPDSSKRNVTSASD